MTVYKGTIKDENGNPLYPATSADKVSGLATVATSGSYTDLSNKPTIPDISGKLDKVSYEWNKAVNFGSSGYLKIGSFPMYDSNITIDIDATTSNTYHGTVVIATQNVSTTSMGSAHKVEVYGDPTGTIANSLRVTWESGSRNYNIFFVPQSWSKNLIHIRASALNASPTDVCTSQTGTAPTTTTGLEPVNKLNIPSIPTTSTAGKVLKSTSTAGTVEWGDVNSGSSDYDDLDHKPIINQYGSATLTSFTNGETIDNGAIIHFDLTKGSVITDFLENISYTSEGGMVEYLVGGSDFILAAYDLSSMNMGKIIILQDREGGSSTPKVIYGTTSGDVGEFAWDEGFNNLDENGDFTLTLDESEEVEVNPLAGWNGVLIWKNSLSYSPSINDGQYFLKGNRLYHKVSTDEKKVLQEGDISFDSTITQSSTNAVQSSAIYNALADKQNSISYSTVNYGTANSMLGLDGNGDLIYDNLPNLSGKQDQISSVQVTIRSNDWYSTNDAPYSYKSNGKTVSGIESTDLVVLINSYDSNKAIRLINRDGTTLYFGTTASSQPSETYQRVLIIKGAADSSRNFANFEIPITESAQFASGTLATAIGFDTDGKLVKGTISAGGVTSVNGQTGAVTGLVDLTSAQTISGVKTFTNGISVSGRSAGGGDDEGIIVGTASNNYAGVCCGSPSGRRAVFYLKPSATSGNSVWRYNNGSTTYDIAHPEKAGTIALTSDIPTKTSDLTNDSGFTANTGTITGVQLNGTSIATSGVANVQALPSYSKSISTSAGNPREVKFVSVNYSTFDGNNAAYFKIGAMCSHGNGSSYTFLEDIIIGVSSTPSVTCTVYKQVQNTSTFTVDSHTVHFGDVYWVVDTTNQCVDFYIIGGQYATINFTPFMRIGNTVSDTSKIVQYTGSATLYSSGTRVWDTLGNGSLYAKTSDLTGKQNTLVSGTNIKTVKGTSLLGSGNITINEMPFTLTYVAKVSDKTLLNSVSGLGYTQNKKFLIVPTPGSQCGICDSSNNFLVASPAPFFISTYKLSSNYRIWYEKFDGTNTGAAMSNYYLQNATVYEVTGL